MSAGVRHDLIREAVNRGPQLFAWFRSVPPGYPRHAVVRALPDGGSGWAASAPSRDAIELRGRGTRSLIAAFDLTQPRLFATGVLQDGGWSARVDGKPIDVELVNGPFVGGWLRPGRGTLELSYWPPGLTAGLLLAALGLCGLVAAWCALAA
jgi:hypothetical protein